MNTITESIQRYFAEKLPLTLRNNTEDVGVEDDNPMGILIGLPYPYNVPTFAPIFQEMAYWDTYFLNTGLILSGGVQQAKNNVDCMRYMIDKYGFVLNQNRTCCLYNSQPPFLAKMVKEIYEVTQDNAWLAEAYVSLKKENDFWQNNRMTDCGLNRYCGDFDRMPAKQKAFYAQSMKERLGSDMGLTDEELARGLLSAGESGWDCNPRMFYETYNYAAVELNSLLYLQETCLAEFAEVLGYNQEAEKWRKQANDRAGLCRKFLRAENNIFYDYHLIKNTRQKMASAACFFPLFCKLATQEEAAATVKLLDKIETDHGVVSCEESDIPCSFQWGYPNGWSPIQRIVVEGLLNYGYVEDALRVATKYANTLERCFAETGHMWEKYNIVTGTHETTNEYEQLPMLGWNYGTYTYFYSVLKQWGVR